MELRDISRRVGIAAGVVTVLARARRTVRGPVGGSYASQLADYYASGVVGGAGIALFALLSVVVVASVERGNLDPEPLAGAAVVLGVATTLSAAAWATAIEPSPMFRDNLWLVWHARVVVALSVLIPVAAAAAYARAAGIASAHDATRYPANERPLRWSRILRSGLGRAVRPRSSPVR